MKRLLAALAALLVAVVPVKAAATGSIAINESGPYHVGDSVTLTVSWDGLKGYEYPVVLMFCNDQIEYFRRWDDDGPLPGLVTGPEPVLLSHAGTCRLELWAYPGAKHGKYEHILATAPAITVDP